MRNFLRGILTRLKGSFAGANHELFHGGNIDQEELRKEKRLRFIKKLAEERGWMLFDIQANIKLARLSRDSVIMNVYYGKPLLTIATILKHPNHKNKTQLFRKHVDYNLFIKILDKPRQHTDIGYYTKKKQ